MSMLFASIAVLLIVAHLDPVNGRPHSKEYHHKKYEEETKETKIYSWTEADGYEECDEFLKFQKEPKPKPYTEACSHDLYKCVSQEELDRSGCGYAKRKLLGGNWATTHINTTKKGGYYDAYMRLDGYRSGNKTKFDKFLGMFVPVMKKWRLDSNNEVVDATMSFYVPEPHQSKPPVPTDPNVKVEEWPDQVIYIRAYGGTRNDTEQLSKQFENLKDALARENIATVPGIKMTAGYTPPGYGSQRIEVILLGPPSTEEEEEEIEEGESA